MWLYFHDDGMGISAEYEVGQGGDREVSFTGWFYSVQWTTHELVDGATEAFRFRAKIYSNFILFKKCTTPFFKSLNCQSIVAPPYFFYDGQWDL